LGARRSLSMAGFAHLTEITVSWRDRITTDTPPRRTHGVQGHRYRNYGCQRCLIRRFDTGTAVCRRAAPDRQRLRSLPEGKAAEQGGSVPFQPLNRRLLIYCETDAGYVTLSGGPNCAPVRLLETFKRR